MNELSDELLIDKTLSGDYGAFALLVKRHKRRVFRISSRFAQNNAEVEDICQDAFLKAFESLKSFRNDAPFEHWISKITVHVCYDTLRKRRPSGVNQALPAELKDHVGEARLAAEEARKFLEWGLAKLRPDERLVITLMELEEKTVKEIAGLTGWSESNVKVKAHRARQALKKILEVDHEN